jgi:hypothetical protein
VPMFFTFTPPISTAPECASQNRGMMRARVDFPDPDGPTRAQTVPEGMSRDTSASAGRARFVS